MIEQKNVPSMRLVAKALLIGPVRVWTDPNSGREMYGVVAVTHDRTGRECLFKSMILFRRPHRRLEESA